VSYEAVRNYHFNREAPAKYHAQVAKKFGVRLEWLITGEGERFEVEEAVEQASDMVQRGVLGEPAAPTKGIDLSVFWGRYPFLGELNLSTQLQFVEVLGNYCAFWGAQASEEYEKIGLQLAKIISRPSEVLPKAEPYVWDWSHVTFDEYVQAMLLALKLATRVQPEEAD